MKDLLKIVKWEVLKNIKNKTFIVLTFVFPIIMIAIGVIAGYFAQAGDGGLDLNVGIIDKTGELSAPLQTSFQENDFEASFFTADREDEIDKIMSERKLDGFLIIPENVVEENKATYYFEELEGAETDFIEDTLSSIIIDKRLINSGYQPDEVLALTRDVSIVTQSLDDSESFISMMLPFGMAFLMVFGSFLSGSLLMQGIIKEKTNRIVEIILSSVPAKTLMGGKVLGYGILGLIQVAIWLCSALLIVMYFDYRVLSSFFSLKILIMFIYFIFGYIIIASLNAIIGASIKDAQTGGQSTGLIMIIPLVPFYFASAIITNPGGIISRVLSYIPLFTPTTMMLRLGTSTPPVYEILLTFVILLITTYLFVRLSSKIFRIGMLMYGKSADLKEIIKWARSKDY